MTRSIIRIDQENNNTCGACGTTCHEGAIEMQNDKNHLLREQSLRNHVASQLCQWPVQLRLVPVHAPYFDGANLLIAADCTAFAYGSFHRDFMRNHVTLIGCPKLDENDYQEKLTQIIAHNNIQSITVVRMEVPCCDGLEHAVKRALTSAEKNIPPKVVTLSTDGKILEEQSFML